MRVARITLRDFRNYGRGEVALGERLTVVSGPNGAGKTNLLEAVYFGATGHSPRTANDRELIRRGQRTTRVALETVDDEGARHLLEVGFAPGEAKRLRVDGSSVQTLAAAPERPLVSVFMPERLELVKGAPSRRRAHLDQVIAAIWPARAETRSAYARTLAQRNALLVRIRVGAASHASLDAWDLELARHGAQLAANRREAVAALRALFGARGREIGLPGPVELLYRPRSGATCPEEMRAELLERREADVERGFTGHGPHRDELQLQLRGEPLRAFGSQGEQRAALLALLLAERDLLEAERARPPLLLLDDVMSELDGARRERLGELLRTGGQAVVTTTDVEQVPGAGAADAVLVELKCPRVGSLVAVGAGQEAAA
jgi:DNA replication and repair protein RecF